MIVERDRLVSNGFTREQDYKYVAYPNGAFKILSSAQSTAAAYLTEVDTAISKGAALVTDWHTLITLPQAEAEIVGKGLSDRVAAGKIETMTFPKFCQKYSR